VRAHTWGATERISDTRVRKVPELTRCVTPLSVATDVIDRPVHDRAVSVECARVAVARIISASFPVTARCAAGRLHES
jgi:hypothetical protein